MGYVMKAISTKVKFKDQWESGKRNAMTFFFSYRRINNGEIFFNSENLFGSTHLNNYLLSIAL